MLDDQGSEFGHEYLEFSGMPTKTGDANWKRKQAHLPTGLSANQTVITAV